MDPGEFAAPAPLPPPPAPWEVEDEDDEDDDTGEGGDVAVKKKPDPPPDWWDDEHPLADNYRMWGTLTLTDLHLSGDPGLIQWTVGRAPDVVILRDPPQKG